MAIKTVPYEVLKERSLQNPEVKAAYDALERSEAVPLTQVCAKCKVVLPREDFSKSYGRYSHGRQRYCKFCAAKAGKAYRDHHKGCKVVPVSQILLTLVALAPEDPRDSPPTERQLLHAIALERADTLAAIAATRSEEGKSPPVLLEYLWLTEEELNLPTRGKEDTSKV